MRDDTTSLCRHHSCAIGEGRSLRKGNVRNISTHGVYIISDQALVAGAEVDLKIALPAEITRTEVLIRAKGKIVRLEGTSEGGSPQVGVAAVIELLEIIRNARH